VLARRLARRSQDQLATDNIARHTVCAAADSSTPYSGVALDSSVAVVAVAPSNTDAFDSGEACVVVAVVVVVVAVVVVVVAVVVAVAVAVAVVGAVAVAVVGAAFHHCCYCYHR